MLSNKITTLQKILNAAVDEFLSKEYNMVSLRNIVKEAGVTTGAFYGYFKSKEELYEHIVGTQKDMFVRMFKEVQDTFSSLSARDQVEKMHSITDDYLLEMVDYVYDHYSAFKILVCKGNPNHFESFIHQLVEIEVESTKNFFVLMTNSGYKFREINPDLSHILASSLFNSIFEFVRHDMDKDQAHVFIKDLKSFYDAGWSKIMGQ